MVPKEPTFDWIGWSVHFVGPVWKISSCWIERGCTAEKREVVLDPRDQRSGDDRPENGVDLFLGTIKLYKRNGLFKMNNL